MISLGALPETSSLLEELDDDDDDDDDYTKLVVSSGGLSKILLSYLEDAYDTWSKQDVDLIMSSSPYSPSMRICDSENYFVLLSTLRLLSKVIKLDPTLGEEIITIGRSSGNVGEKKQGRSFNTICSNLITQIDRIFTYTSTTTFVNSNDNDDNIMQQSSNYEYEDALSNLQDVVYELYPSTTIKSSFKMLTSISSLVDDDILRCRLPLIYELMPVHCENGTSYFKQQQEQQQQNQHEMTILISQITKRQSAQADVGFVMWPSAIVLARYLITNPQCITSFQKKDDNQNNSKCATTYTIMELGAGCGLVGITAARIILSSREHINRSNITKRSNSFHVNDDNKTSNDRNEETVVVITDVNEVVLQNIMYNIELNNVTSVTSVAKLDFYKQSGDCHLGKWVAEECIPRRTTGNNSYIASSTINDEDKGRGEGSEETISIERERRGSVDVILAADIICQPEDAIAVSKTIYDALRPGGIALVVCANAEHRYGVEYFARECDERGMLVSSTDVATMYNGELLSGTIMETAAGYIEGMRMTFFKVTKKIISK
jgi:predicted nicotinamide N-methyase